MVTEGKVIKGIGGFYYVKTEEGLFECRGRGILRKEKVSPLAGDQVEISVWDAKEKKGSLDKIFPRKNQLHRPKVANVDCVVIVLAAVSPSPNLDMLDRLLLLAEAQRLNVILCINKIDLDLSKSYRKLQELYQEKVGYPVYLISVQEMIGVNEFLSDLQEPVTVFAGPSGVGKSSLINAVAPGFCLKTGSISEKIERGKHTTRASELFEWKQDHFFVDSPGFTSLQLDTVKLETIAACFREFEPYLDACRFSGCSHRNEPGCKVREQLGENITEMRYNRYLRFYEEKEREVRR